MKLGFLKQHITYTFIAIFLSLKVAGLHVLTHDHNDTIEHCEVCNIISNNNFTPIINDITQSFVSNNYVCCIQEKVIIHYGFAYTTSINITNLFSRPPPFFK
ncbi:hypothetical protein [Tenacibaculum ovolyticum]|uniref:hypothetical protein n=1 Tax=Tenacibaculum ovolyticum TaxID=104270 RepID=UPI001F1C0E86|nr:hypothetical protein [Tenacibaculum ovolyticum]